MRKLRPIATGIASMTLGVALFFLAGTLSFDWFEAGRVGPAPLTVWLSAAGIPIAVLGFLLALYGASERLIRHHAAHDYR